MALSRLITRKSWSFFFLVFLYTMKQKYVLLKILSYSKILENFYVALEKCKRHCVTSACPTERIEGMLAGKSAQVTEKETCTTAAEGC